MPGEIAIPLGALYAFLLVITRIGGALVFVPWPGIVAGSVVARIVMVAAIALAVMPAWPKVSPEAVTAGQMAVWIGGEAAFGITAGVIVSFINEGFVLAAQIFGLQAGYSFASTFDPTTQADSTVLQSLTLLMASLLFMVLGLDRQVLLAFARSFESYPPGAFAVSHATVDEVVRLGSGMFSTALRLALPVVTLLALVDLALALLGRINVQLQLLTLAFPVKMLVSMALLAAMAGILPSVYEEAAGRSLRALFALARRAN